MEPIKRVPLVHQVEERIKDLIKEEKLQPGTKLPTENQTKGALYELKCQSWNCTRSIPFSSS